MGNGQPTRMEAYDERMHLFAWLRPSELRVWDAPAARDRHPARGRDVRGVLAPPPHRRCRFDVHRPRRDVHPPSRWPCSSWKRGRSSGDGRSAQASHHPPAVILQLSAIIPALHVGCREIPFTAMTFVEQDLSVLIHIDGVSQTPTSAVEDLSDLVTSKYSIDQDGNITVYARYFNEDAKGKKLLFEHTFDDSEFHRDIDSKRYELLTALCEYKNLPIPEDKEAMYALIHQLITEGDAYFLRYDVQSAYDFFQLSVEDLCEFLSQVEEPHNSDETVILSTPDIPNFTLKGRWEDPQKLSLLMLGLMGYQKANAVMQVLALETCGTRYPELNGKTLAEYIDEITPEYGYDAPMFAVAAIVEPRLQQRRQEAEAFQIRVEAQKERGIDVGNLTMEERFRTQLEGMVAVAQQHQQGNDEQENEAFQVVQEQSKMLGWIAYDDIPEKRPQIEVKYNRQTTEQFAGMIADLRTRYPSLEEEAIMAGLLSLHGLDYSPSVVAFMARIEELDPENSTELLNLTHEQMAVLLAKEMEIRTRPGAEGQDPAEVQSTEPQPAEQHLLKIAAALHEEERYFINIQEKTGGYLLTLQEQPDGTIEAFPCEDNAEAMDTVLAETGQLVERFLPVQPVLPEPLEEEMMLLPPFFPPFEPQPLPEQPVEDSGEDAIFEEPAPVEPVLAETPDLPAPPWYIQRPGKTPLEVSLPDVQEREPRIVATSSTPTELPQVLPVRIPPAMPPVAPIPAAPDVFVPVASEEAVVPVPSERRGQPVAEVEERVVVRSSTEPVGMQSQLLRETPEADINAGAIPETIPSQMPLPASAPEAPLYGVKTQSVEQRRPEPMGKPVPELSSPSESRPAAITEPVVVPESVQPAQQESQPRLVEARTATEVAVEEVAQIERRYEVGSVVSAAFAAIEAVQESVVQEQALQEAFGTQSTVQTQAVRSENTADVQTTTSTEQQATAQFRVEAEAEAVETTTTRQSETVTTLETQTATAQREEVQTVQAETASAKTVETTETIAIEESRTAQTQVTAETAVQRDTVEAELYREPAQAESQGMTARSESKKDKIEVSSQGETTQVESPRGTVEVNSQSDRVVASEMNRESASPVEVQSSTPVTQETRITGAVNRRTFGSTGTASTARQQRISGASTEAAFTMKPGVINSEGNGGELTIPAETKGASEEARTTRKVQQAHSQQSQEAQEQGTFEQRQKHQTSAAQQTALQQAKTQQNTRDQARATLQMLKQPPRGVLNSPRLRPARPNSVNVVRQIRRTLSASNAAAMEPGKVELHMLSQAFQQSCVTANCPLTNLVVNRFKNNGQRCHLQQSDIDTFVQGNASWFQRRSSVQLVHLIDESGRPVRTPAVAIATGTTRKEVKSALEQPLRQDQLPPNVKIIPSTFALSA